MQNRDAVRVAALVMLLGLIIRREPRPLALRGREDELCQMLIRGDDPEHIAATLDLSADAVVAALWRLTQ